MSPSTGAAAEAAGGEGSAGARSGDVQAKIYEASVRHFLAPVLAYIDDPSVSEIMINGPHEVYVERAGKVTRTDATFGSDERLAAAVRNIAQFAGRAVTEATPRFDARLPDGSRVHVVNPPSARKGTTVAIRKFAKSLFDLARLARVGSISETARDFLAKCVKGRKNLIVAGGTGTGKTSFLNALSAEIPESERILTIEDSAELQFRQPHVVTLEAQTPDARGRGGVSIRDLVHSALRLRPDRIVVGECRGGEALDLVQAMASGHPGSMSTIHASSTLGALYRLETLAMMSDLGLPHAAIRAQVRDSIDLVVHIVRFPDGTRRVVEIAEVLREGEPDKYEVAELFRFEGVAGDEAGQVRGALRFTGRRPTFAKAFREVGLLSGEATPELAAVWGLED
jgi:pilus assembly protein CpaF